MATKEEQLLRRLRKLEANSRCANCHTAAPRGIGFGNVCVKFGTFVCDMCKTSHQAVSHRVKSVSMSTWTMEEVQALEYPVGGNEAAALRWLRNAPAPGQRSGRTQRPKPGDDIAVFKQFVVDCYDRGLFRSDEPLPEKSPSANVRSVSQSPVSATKVVVASSCVAKFPEVSLLDLPMENNPKPDWLDNKVDVFSFDTDAFSTSHFGAFDEMKVAASVPQTSTRDAHINGEKGPVADLFGEFTSAEQQPQPQLGNSTFDDVFSEFTSFTAPPDGSVSTTSHVQETKPPIDLDALYGTKPSMPPEMGTQHPSPKRYAPSAISSMLPPAGHAVPTAYYGTGPSNRSYFQPAPVHPNVNNYYDASRFPVGGQNMDSPVYDPRMYPWDASRGTLR